MSVVVGCLSVCLRAVRTVLGLLSCWRLPTSSSWRPCARCSTSGTRRLGLSSRRLMSTSPASLHCSASAAVTSTTSSPCRSTKPSRHVSLLVWYAEFSVYTQWCKLHSTPLHIDVYFALQFVILCQWTFDGVTEWLCLVFMNEVTCAEFIVRSEYLTGFRCSSRWSTGYIHSHSLTLFRVDLKSRYWRHCKLRKSTPAVLFQFNSLLYPSRMNTSVCRL